MFGAGGIVVTFDLVNQTFQSVVVQPMCLPSGVGETSGTDQQSSVFDHGWAKCVLSFRYKVGEWHSGGLSPMARSESPFSLVHVSCVFDFQSQDSSAVQG